LNRRSILFISLTLMKKPVVTTFACALAAGSLLFTPSHRAQAGVQINADKEVAKQAVEQEKEPFPVHFSLTAGYDSDFVFRGINLLPEKNLNLPKATALAIRGLPDFRAFLANNGLTPRQFANSLGFPSNIKVARDSDIGYFDGNISGTFKGTTLRGGAFYAMQTTPRIEPKFFGGKSFFFEYREIDAYLSASHSFGPVSINLGGTYYHVEKSSQFDTAELNAGISYTPEQFRYVTASLSYDYAGSTKFPQYLDGHHGEARIDANIPVPIPGEFVKADFNPFISASVGQGIVPRAFSLTNFPTYFSDKTFAESLKPLLQGVLNGTGAIGNNPSAFNPAQLDRDFDLNNFQVGAKLRFYFGKYITLTGDGNYSRPLGNLQRQPYNQKDIIWGGANLNFFF
jgi:hypothetical protein